MRDTHEMQVTICEVYKHGPNCDKSLVIIAMNYYKHLLLLVLILGYTTCKEHDEDIIDLTDYIKTEIKLVVNSDFERQSSNKQPNCQAANFKALQACCRSPLGNNFINDTVQTLCRRKVITGSDTHIKDYLFNKLQLPNNTINWESTANGRAIGPSTCITRCMFYYQGMLYDNGTIKVEEMKKRFVQQSTDEWKEKIVDMIDYCVDYIKDYPRHKLPIPVRPGYCDMDPIYMMQCIRYQELQKCPDENFNTRNQKNCENLKEILPQCKIQLPATGKRDEISN